MATRLLLSNAFSPCFGNCKGLLELPPVRIFKTICIIAIFCTLSSYSKKVL